MRGKEFLEHHLHRYLSTSLLYCIVVTSIGTYYHFHLPVVAIILLVCLWVAGVCAFDQNKKTPIPYLILAIVAIATVLVCMNNEFQFLEQFKSYTRWLRDMDIQNEMTEVSEGISLAYTFFSILVVNIICTPFYFLTKWKATRLGLAMIGSVVGFGMIFTNYQINQSASAFFYAYLFLCLIEFSLSQKQSIHSQKSLAMTTFLSPFVLVLLILLCLLPTSDSPMEYRTLKHIWSQIREYGNQLVYDLGDLFDKRKASDFSLSFAGFSEDGTIQGGLINNDEVALSVKDISNGKLNLYLIGNVKNEFTGSGWVDSVQKDQRLSGYAEYELDLYELLNAVDESFNSFRSQNIMHARTLEVQYRKMDTNTLFYPLKVGYLDLIDGLSDFDSKTASLFLDKLPDYHAKYQVSTLELRLGSKSTDEFLMEQTRKPFEWKEIDCNQLEKNVQTYLMNTKLEQIDDLSSILKYRARKIQENYTMLPEGLPERVVTLSKELTKDAASGYEKLKRIEAYLNTYTYTTHPNQVPDGKDLIDYFLFESKEGYCTYFATTMAIMARCIGIPTRYVQGYCIPTTSSAKEYEVTGNQAHAWVEAYFEGIGWIPFEPTAGYSEYMYQAKEIYDKEKLDMTLDTSAFYEQQAQAMRDQLANDLERIEKGDSTLTRGKTYAYAATIILSIIGLAVLISVLYLSFRIRYYNLSYEKASREDKLYILLQRCLVLIQYFKFCDLENATLLMQFLSLNQVIELNSYQPLRIANHYMRLRYAEEMLSESDEIEMVEFYRALLNYAKIHTKKLNYYLLTLKLTRQRAEKKHYR